MRRLAVSQLHHGGHYTGVCEVELDLIRGSEGRSAGFDDQLHPVSETVRQRWQRVAAVLDKGIWLQPVVLIQVVNEDYVRDGHHRISLSRAFGLATIVAEITVWDSLYPV
jgi:hypothetical protein